MLLALTSQPVSAYVLYILIVYISFSYYWHVLLASLLAYIVAAWGVLLDMAGCWLVCIIYYSYMVCSYSMCKCCFEDSETRLYIFILFLLWLRGCSTGNVS